MRQVPKVTYLIIGNGRTARHILHYLGLLDYPTLNWHYRSQKSCQNTACFSEPADLRRLADQSDRILLLIKDSAIESFLELYPFLRTKKTVHFSGALDVQGISNCHPLISFSHELFELDFYRRIPFARFNEMTDLNQILPGLKNPSFFVPKQSKPLYHGLCVAGGNLMVLLWQLVEREFTQHFGVNHDLLIPYLESITGNLKNHWHQALTGPIARRDENTLNKNYVALTNTPLKAIFEAHIREAWPEFADRHFNQDSSQTPSL
jgi:hypothetical protein